MSIASFDYEHEVGGSGSHYMNMNGSGNGRLSLDQASLFGVAGQVVVITGGGTGALRVQGFNCESQRASFFLIMPIPISISIHTNTDTAK